MEHGIKSGFISPAYTNLALGIQWTPSGYFDINIAPLTGGFTIVTNQALRSSYGMKELTEAVKDEEGNITTPATYASTLFQFGAQVKEIDFKLDNRDAIYEAYDFITLGEPDKALPIIDKFLSENPSIWNGYFLKGWALRIRKDYKEARECFLACLKLVEGNSEIYNELSICELELGNREPRHLMMLVE